MKIPLNRMLPFALAAAALAAVAPVAAAQSRSTGVLTTRGDDGQQSVVVTMVDGEVRVEVNGEPVPPDRIVRRGEGGVFEILLPGDKKIHFRADAEGRIQFIDPAPVEALPRGRIGVTLSQVDDTLAAHLGLDARNVFLISGVTEGQPAERAGLKQHDIVTHINGEAPVTIALLTRLVAEMAPGEHVRFRVLRKGQPVEIEVEVEAAPTDRLSVLQRELGRTHQRPHNLLQGHLELGQAHAEALRGQLEQLLGQGGELRAEAERMAARVRESQVELAAKLRKEVENIKVELDEETMKAVRQAMLEAAKALEGLDVNIRLEPGGAAPRIEFLPDGYRRGAVVQPRQPAPPRPGAAGGSSVQGRTPASIQREIDTQTRNREEQERLKRLEERMERLEALLERLVERAG